MRSIPENGIQRDAPPFFIVGNPRSGTTLLRFILSSHPAIYVPEETGFIPSLQVDARSSLTLQDVSDILDRIGALNVGWRGMVNDVDAFYNDLPQQDLAHVLDALYHKKAAIYGARRWGDKTPTYVRFMPHLSQIFPDAQFIHIVRDGRDVTLSAQKKWGRDRWYMDNYYLLKNWVKNVEAGRAAGHRLGPNRYLEITYELLVKDPDRTIKTIATFLNEPTHPAMLQHTDFARQEIGPRGHVEVRHPISIASVGRWRSQMSSFDKKMTDRVAGPTLSGFGYPLAEAGPLSLAERVRLHSLMVKYYLVEAFRAILYTSGLLTLNRKKRKR